MSAASSSKACNFSIVFSALFALECPGKLSHLIKLIGEVFKLLWTIGLSLSRATAFCLFVFNAARRFSCSNPRLITASQNAGIQTQTR